MPTDATLVDRIRSRIVGELHLGHLRAGDRLPPVRALARELGTDHRAVARAYHALEAERLLEVRGRAGVYLARQERIGGGVVEETAAWLAGVLAEAHRRRIAIPHLPEFIRRCTASVRPRCACLESNLDSGDALCRELGDECGMDALPVWVDDLPRAGTGKKLDPAALPGELRDADLVVTTTFHAREAALLAEALCRPSVVVTVHPEMAGIIERRARAGGLTAIVADPRYGERFRALYGRADGAGGIRVILAGDAPAIAMLDRFEPVLVTRAARRLLPDLELPLLLPRYPSISPESTRALAEHLIRLNLERAAL
ncbi:MAG TPA: GntR family transcriptional regulator [Longimicrobiaceae bacterium]|nr:GntR family transcriptional regulator [Longimicrobiaceae bacterium]